jgi:Pin2-interacting protein X1
MNPHYATEYTTLSGYGLKMMEKHGFKVGTGVGKKEEKVQEIIQVRKKEDNMGIGATHKVEDKWWERLYDKALQGTPKPNVEDDQPKKEKKSKKEKVEETESDDEIRTCKRYKQKGKMARIQAAEERLSVTKKPKQ